MGGVMLAIQNLHMKRSAILGYKVFLIGLLILVLAGARSNPVQAQSVKTPLYVLLKPVSSRENDPNNWHVYLNVGNLWKWSGGSQAKLTQITHWGYNALP